MSRMYHDVLGDVCSVPESYLLVYLGLHVNCILLLICLKYV